MKTKSIIYWLVAFVVPWIIFAIAILKPIYNVWLYVGSITWFLTALFISFSLYKF